MSSPALLPPPPNQGDWDLLPGYPPDKGLIPGRLGELLPPHRLSLVERLRIWWAHPFHRWETVKDTGHNLYEHCTICGERRAYRYTSSGYQMIDRQWIATGEWHTWDMTYRGAGTGCSPIGKVQPTPLPGNRPEWPDLYREEADR